MLFVACGGTEVVLHASPAGPAPEWAPRVRRGPHRSIAFPGPCVTAAASSKPPPLFKAGACFYFVACYYFLLAFSFTVHTFAMF